MAKDNNTPQGFSRRRFLTTLALGGAGSAGRYRNPPWRPWGILVPLVVDNPLQAYPDRDWENRTLYAHDSTFMFLCAPNDTHNCLLNAFVKNGVVTRIGPTYGFGKATDLDGKAAICCRRAPCSPITNWRI